MGLWSDIKGWWSQGLLPSSAFGPGLGALAAGGGEATVHPAQAAKNIAATAVAGAAFAGGLSGAVKLGQSFSGAIRAIGRHPVGAALSSGTTIRLARSGLSEIRAARKRSLTAARKARLDAERAKTKAAKAALRAAQASARVSGRRAKKSSAVVHRRKRVSQASAGKATRAKRPRRKMTAKQLQYFGTKHQRKRAA